jgi:hypothetical protein
MYHRLRFKVRFVVDLQISRSQPLERMLIRRGAVLEAQLRPYVMETPSGPFEVADLYFRDGTVGRHVPFSYFRFEEKRLGKNS